jgi:cytochrome c2
MISMAEDENMKNTVSRYIAVPKTRLSIQFVLSAVLFMGAATPDVFAKDNQSPGNQNSAPDGRRITQELSCKSCHIIESEGGTIGPPLDGISKYISQAQIESRLSKAAAKAKFPPFLTPKEIMSHARLPAAQAKAVSVYLSKLPNTESKWNISHHGGNDTDSVPQGVRFSPRKADASSEHGKQLYLDHGCAACHSIGETGGRIGPSLLGIGARRSHNFIESRITTGAILGPNRSGEYKRMGYRMPPQTVSAKEAADITNFLLTLPESKEHNHTKE